MAKIIPLFGDAEPRPAAETAAEPPKEKLKRRKDNLYHLEHRYKDEAGISRRKSFYGKTQAEAKKKRDEFKRAIDNGENISLRDVSVTAWVEKWLAARKTKYKTKPTTRTYDTHKREADRLLDAAGAKRLRDVVRSDIESIINTRAGMSKKSIRQTYNTLHSIFEAARGDRIITFNPCDGISLPEGTEGSHRALTADERALITTTWTEHRMGIVAMLMLYAGLRRGEAVALKWDDIGSKHIHVRSAVAYNVNQPIEKDTKTKAGKRDVLIVAPLRMALDKYSSLPHASEYVCTSAGEVQFTQSAFERGWESYLYFLSVKNTGCVKNWCERKGIKWNPISLRTHDLRHSYCTMLYDAGVDVKRAQELMGHTDLSVTMKIYTHLSDEKRGESDSSMEKYFGREEFVGKYVGKSRKYYLKKP